MRNIREKESAPESQPVLRGRIENSYQSLRRLKDYRPSPRVNRLFAELVAAVLASYDEAALDTEKNGALQRICSDAESELERYWARKIADSANPAATLAEFPYLENYHELTRIEWATLCLCRAHAEHRFLFVGGGPLPLTAIVLAREYGQSVVVLDNDSQACALARAVVKALKLSARIEILHADALGYAGYKNFDVILLAALVGAQEGLKLRVIKQIKSNALKGLHLVVRSSWGAREALYAPLEKAVYDLWKPLIEVRPGNGVINSVVVFSNR